MTCSDSLMELRHIQFELENRRDRPRHMRHFVDQYYCYKKGYVTKTGSPNWDMIFFNENEFLSADARVLFNSEVKVTAELKKQVRKEHVIPLNIIIRELVKNYENGKKSVEDIASIIDELLIFATITKAEDSKLRENNLNASMPEGYYNPGDPLYMDRFARYKVANIIE